MGKKIMVVDDSSAVRKQVMFALKEGGYEFVEAEDGKVGLEKLKATPDVAVIICDVNMPNMTGVEMLEAIEADTAIKLPPVVMLTTEGAPDLIDRAKKAGAKGWLVKPFKADQLATIAAKLTA